MGEAALTEADCLWPCSGESVRRSRSAALKRDAVEDMEVTVEERDAGKEKFEVAPREIVEDVEGCL